MSNQTLLNARLRIKTNNLEKISRSASAMKQRAEDLAGALGQTTDKGDIEAVKAELATLQDELKEKMEEKATLEKEIEEIQEQIDLAENNLTEDGENENMRNNVETFKKKRALNRFIKTRGAVQLGLEMVDREAIVPVDEIANHTQKVNQLDLTQYVRTVKTGQGYGNFLIMKKSNMKFSEKVTSATSATTNPEFITVPYEVKTFGGQIPISLEMVDDAEFDIAELASEHLKDRDINTKTAEIIKAFKTATAKTVTGLDGIVSLFNNDLETMYNAKAFVSTSLFNELDTLKDQSGRFLLQDDATVASGKRIKGKEVVVLPDTEIGAQSGDLVGFFGDAYEFAVLFDRKQITIKWIDNIYHGELLGGYVRFDVQPADTEAGYYVTYTPAV